jgi:hypothetical protein
MPEDPPPYRLGYETRYPDFVLGGVPHTFPLVVLDRVELEATLASDLANSHQSILSPGVQSRVEDLSVTPLPLSGRYLRYHRFVQITNWLSGNRLPAKRRQFPELFLLPVREEGEDLPALGR